MSLPRTSSPSYNIFHLEAPGFGRATSTLTPGRRVQFHLKFSF